jgi:D-alanyl-D-alanine carboxypeptidase (penicillin-binding protein 5/6)
VQAEGSKVGLKEGSQYRVRDLFDGMLMPSGNDAATALASAYGGIEPATQAMAAEATRLGANDTVVKNTSGLDEPGQVTTAYDLALILRESLKNPQLQEIYKQHRGLPRR